MSSFFTKSQINKITDLALQAGEIATESFREKNFTVERKADGSRVTSADIAVSKFLHEHLEKEFPHIPIICEEGELRKVSGDIFFLIDPIDGTSSFAKDNVEFCVSIALVKDKKAISGLIYAPLFENGKMVFSNELDHVILRDNFGNQKILETPGKKTLSSLRVITSPRSKDEDIEIAVTKICPDFSNNFTIEKLASAIKFFRLLEGDTDLYLHFRPSMEWDIASGQALVEMLGGKVKILGESAAIGENLSYKKANLKNSPFISYLHEIPC